ncbi:hypothetical protein D3C75_604000 [compost metagenome]
MPWAWPAPKSPGIIELRLSAATPAIARLTSAPASRAGRALPRRCTSARRAAEAFTCGRPSAWRLSSVGEVARTSLWITARPSGLSKKRIAASGSGRLRRRLSRAR